jgi:hypothetical protein
VTVAFRCGCVADMFGLDEGFLLNEGSEYVIWRLLGTGDGLLLSLGKECGCCATELS